MKIIILQENLLEILKDVSGFVPSAPQLAILENVLIETKENGITIKATDLSIGILKTKRAKIESSGRVCVNAKNILALVGQLSPGKVSLIATEDKLLINTESTSAELNINKAEEFPPFPECKTTREIEKKKISEIAGEVVFAAAKDETRQVLTGINIEKNGDKERFVATDGFRLAIKEINKGILNNDDKPIIAPARMLLDINKLAQKENKISIGVSDEKNTISASWEGTIIVAQLIQGKYPDFEKIIPASFMTRATIDKRELEKIIKTAAVFARESANIIRISINKDTIEVSANSPQIGRNKSRAPAVIKGEPVKTAFNYRFLLDLIKSAIGEEIIFETAGSLKPGVFKVKEDPSYLHIIMPVRVQEEK